MLRLLIILVSAAIFALGPTTTKAGAEAISIKAEASAAVRQGGADVKAAALEEALKKAVLEAVTSLAGAEKPAPHALDQILSDHRAFITNYRVITERWIETPAGSATAEVQTEAQEGDVYSAMVEASVDVERLREALAKTRANEASDSLTVTIIEVTDYPAFQALVTAIKKTPAVRDTAYDSFLRGRISITIRSNEGAARVAQSFSSGLADGYEVHSNGPKNIFIKAVSKAGTAR